MKNIHILPTDKPSRLHTWINNKGLRATLYEQPQIEVPDTAKNIYITNSEQTKEGDYRLDIRNNSIYKSNKEDSELYDNTFRKKIILTTDQDLIKDGIQEIDDDFLQWFVKNPSCEEVDFWKYMSGEYSTMTKEEPKDVVLGYKTSLVAKSLDSHYVDFSNPNADKITSASTTTIKEEPKQELPIINGSYGCTIETNKKETLEEGFYRIRKSIDYEEFDFTSFELGAKWQQERSYSDEEVELIALEMVTWGFENVGNPNPQSGKKFDEVISKFKKK